MSSLLGLLWSFVVVFDGSALAAGAEDGPSALAPGPAELLSEVEELERRVEAAEAALTALRRVHNALAEQLRREVDPCVDAGASSLVARSPSLGAFSRDRLQAARVELSRVERLAQAPTVRALVDGALYTRLGGLRARVEAGAQGYMELIAWQEAFVSPWGRCPAALSASPGIGVTASRTLLEEARLVAILGVGEGRICPTDVPADGRVLLVEGVACWSAGACDCEPTAVEPAAVLGPPLPP